MTTAPEGRGGYRAPSNPAPVSGPGALSQRTDGGPTQGAKYVPGLPYGQGQQTYSNQVAAPMAGNPFEGALGGPITPLTAPTERPDEPITSGMSFGAGPGPEVLPAPPTQRASLASTLQQLIQYDPSGEAELAYRMIVDSGSMG